MRLNEIKGLTDYKHQIDNEEFDLKIDFNFATHQIHEIYIRDIYPDSWFPLSIYTESTAAHKVWHDIEVSFLHDKDKI